MLTSLPGGAHGSRVRKVSLRTEKVSKLPNGVRRRRMTMQGHAASQRARQMLEMDRECGRETPNEMPLLAVFCEEQNEAEPAANAHRSTLQAHFATTARGQRWRIRYENACANLKIKRTHFPNVLQRKQKSATTSSPYRILTANVGSK